jgi:uncharacterized Zn finger protein (UPF0148 family)
MTARHCPRCQRQSLAHTGGFWKCGICGYAITQVALAVEHRESPANEKPLPTGQWPEVSAVR